MSNQPPEDEKPTALQRVTEVATEVVVIAPAAGLGGVAGGVGFGGAGAALGFVVGGPPGAAVGYLAGVVVGTLGGSTAAGIGAHKVKKLLQED